MRVLEDPGACARVWERFHGRTELFDLWEVRDCFQRAFQWPLRFVVAEAGAQTVGLLPLSKIEDAASYGFFPGETWHGETWLEQNRVHAADAGVFRALLEAAPRPAKIRYLHPDCIPAGFEGAVVDEIGYLFHPAEHGYSFADYQAVFSTKATKKMRRELDALEARGLSFRFDHRPDAELIFRMNLDAFGEYSYFADARFLRAFEDLVRFLDGQGALRLTTVLIGGREAAVDMGAVWHGNYTLLAGGTRAADFPGVAKLINFHHIERACRERFRCVDFLCGDFGWKERFHLTPRPLYRIADAAQPPAGEAL